MRDHLRVATGPWSDDEIGVTVDVYFRMLTLELAGETYTKTEFRREVERDVDRSSGAIEYKFNNVSAVLDEIGAVWIPGYKPLRNVQDRLRRVVRERFEGDSDLRAFMLKAVADGDVGRAGLGAEVDPPDGRLARRARPSSRCSQHQLCGARVGQQGAGSCG